MEDEILKLINSVQWLLFLIIVFAISAVGIYVAEVVKLTERFPSLPYFAAWAWFVIVATYFETAAGFGFVLGGALIVISLMCLVLYGSLLSQTRYLRDVAYAPYTLFYYLAWTWFGLPFVPSLSPVWTYVFGTFAALESVGLIVFLICGQRKEKEKMLVLMALLLAVLCIVAVADHFAVGDFCFTFALAFFDFMMIIEILWMARPIVLFISDRVDHPFLRFLP